jgi:hypothetical protein
MYCNSGDQSHGSKIEVVPLLLLTTFTGEVTIDAATLVLSCIAGAYAVLFLLAMWTTYQERTSNTRSMRIVSLAMSVLRIIRNPNHWKPARFAVVSVHTAVQLVSFFASNSAAENTINKATLLMLK